MIAIANLFTTMFTNAKFFTSITLIFEQNIIPLWFDKIYILVNNMTLIFKKLQNAL